jgi:hypothetical protein
MFAECRRFAARNEVHAAGRQDPQGKPRKIVIAVAAHNLMP